MKKEDTKTKEIIYDPEIEILLSQFSESRTELKKYMTDVDGIRAKVEAIFPTNTDYRNRFVLEEKIKAMSSFYSTLLNIRQEFNKSIKEEIELRRKMSTANKGEGEDALDIRAVAALVEEELEKKEKDLEPRVSSDIEDEVDEISEIYETES